MSLASDLRVLYHLLLKPVRGQDHAARMESFYAGQAEAYDGFRNDCCPGDASCTARSPVPADGLWVDLGGGTGSNQELLGPRLGRSARSTSSTCRRSLLKMAQQRIVRHGWSNVETVRGGCHDVPARGRPGRRRHVLLRVDDDSRLVCGDRERAAMLKPGGLVGVVDFHVSRKHPAERHGDGNRGRRDHFGPSGLPADNVFFSADHVPFLAAASPAVVLYGRSAKIPYFPLGRVPYYTFLGRKRA